MITIRPATIDDAAAYRQLRERIDGESDTWGADPGERYASNEAADAFLQSVIAEPNSRLFLAEDGHNLIGFLLAVAGKWRRARHAVSIDVGILASHCGQGLGERLFLELEAWARAQGIRRIELFVRESNQRARRLYEKRGFDIEGVRRGSLRIGDEYFNEVWMAKLL
jgi:ribosomal protein S18 acetylase RimI-like enzyme